MSEARHPPPPGPRNILVLSAGVGAGHVRAAEAVELWLRREDPEALVRHVDVLTLTNALFRRLYARAYLDLVNRAPHLVGLFYDLTDRAASPARPADRFRTLVQRVNLRALGSLLAERPWDVIVNTHFLAPELIARLHRLRRLRIPQVTAVTDVDAHALWVHSPTERYFVATDEASLSLQRWRVEPHRIQITGIPVHPLFAQPLSPADARRTHALSTDRPVILLLAGGFGVGPVAGLYDALLRVDRPLHVVVVCGKNERLRAQLQAVGVPDHHRATVMGFTKAMDELMAAADLVVSKPGGLTTSECLARGVPLAIVNPIPGQESRNSDYLLEQGAAIKINSLASASWKLSRLLAEPDRLAALRSRAAALGRPFAGRDIARAVLAAPPA